MFTTRARIFYLSAGLVAIKGVGNAEQDRQHQSQFGMLHMTKYGVGQEVRRPGKTACQPYPRELSHEPLDAGRAVFGGALHRLCAMPRNLRARAAFVAALLASSLPQDVGAHDAGLNRGRHRLERT